MAPKSKKNIKAIFNNQYFVLTTTGIPSLVISFLYYTIAILPYIKSIGFWNTTLFFDSYTLMIILWFMSILTIHSLTNPDKYYHYFNPD